MLISPPWPAISHVPSHHSHRLSLWSPHSLHICFLFLLSLVCFENSLWHVSPFLIFNFHVFQTRTVESGGMPYLNLDSLNKPKSYNNSSHIVMCYDGKNPISKWIDYSQRMWHTTHKMMILRRRYFIGLAMQWAYIDYLLAFSFLLLVKLNKNITTNNIFLIIIFECTLNLVGLLNLCNATLLTIALLSSWDLWRPGPLHPCIWMSIVDELKPIPHANHTPMPLCTFHMHACIKFLIFISPHDPPSWSHGGL